MKIHKTFPDAPTDQFKADAPSIKAMNRILPFAAALSAASLAGGIAAFLSLPILSFWGLPTTLLLFLFAWHYDQTAVVSGQSVVRELILIRLGMNRGTWFLASLVFSAIICIFMAIGSFFMSRSGVEYLVIQLKKDDTVNLLSDSTLFRASDNSDQRLQMALDLENKTYQDQKQAIEQKYKGQIQALEAEIKRKESQRTTDNTLFIDSQLSRLNKQIAGKIAEQGKELSTLSASFQARQSQILSKMDTLQSITLNQAQKDQDRSDKKAEDLEAKNKMVAGVISAIFSYSVFLMLAISIRLTILETRNQILPAPILENSDISGADLNLRWVTAIPAYFVSWWIHLSEKLYEKAPDRPIPVIDDRIIDFSVSGEVVQAVKKSDLKQIGREEKAGKILDAVKVAENTKDEKERLSALRLIEMYLQTSDKDALETFYIRCVAFLDGNAPNPFHTRTEITGFKTQLQRDASHNALRGKIRVPDTITPGSLENSAKVVPPGMNVCEHCRTIYAPRTTHQRFCKTSCRSEYHRQKGGHATEYKERFS